jgi:hypothetical protein
LSCWWFSTGSGRQVSSAADHWRSARADVLLSASFTGSVSAPVVGAVGPPDVVRVGQTPKGAPMGGRPRGTAVLLLRLVHELRQLLGRSAEVGAAEAMLYRFQVRPDPVSRLCSLSNVGSVRWRHIVRGWHLPVCSGGHRRRTRFAQAEMDDGHSGWTLVRHPFSPRRWPRFLGVLSAPRNWCPSTSSPPGASPWANTPAA